MPPSTSSQMSSTIVARLNILSYLRLIPMLSFILRTMPGVAKFLVALLVLVNARSFPFVWHFRVFRPVILLRVQHRLLRLKTLLKPRWLQDAIESQWLDSISPIGKNPLQITTTYRTWAGPDDIDFNRHLSNSSYAKTLDSARFKAAMTWFPQFYRCGGWSPLAATHYHFIREIPMFSKYEVRISLGSWDDKWFYIVCKFVTMPSVQHKAPTISITGSSNTSPSPPDSTPLFSAPISTPADESILPSSCGTPLPGTPPSDIVSGQTSSMDALKSIASTLGSIEPDGATLHTVNISQHCFKHGRITVPPGLVLAMNGFSGPPSDSGVAYSRKNPPPHWPTVKSLCYKSEGGDFKKIQALLRGGWRDIPPEQRWWTFALDGVEEQRQRNLVALHALRHGMEGVRNM